VAEELETAAADSLADLTGPPHQAAPEHGAACANCGTVLQGPFCHACGQDSDTHKRSIIHLAWEAVEGVFHVDGRLLRTLPDLFLRPGRLARDYMEGRVARHVPPFRTFLVALLLFIFAAEHATHEEIVREGEQRAALAAALATPQGRAREAGKALAEAARERDSDLAEAARDRAEDLKDPDANRANTEARYVKAVQRAGVDYAIELDKADRVAKGLPPETSAEAAAHAGVQLPKKRMHWWTAGLHKATANPEYYLTVMFTWGHRLAALLLPIVGLSLALVYRNKPRYFIHDHLLVAMNLLSFAFLANAVGLILPPPLMFYWLGLVAIWTPINLFQTLRGAYGSSIFGATLKTLIVWATSVFAFLALLIGLLVFTLTQL
jgi:hypothetical protein